MPSSPAIRARVAGTSTVLLLLLLAACGDRGAPPAGAASAGAGSGASPSDRTPGGGAGDAAATAVDALAPLLARAAEPGLLPEAERRSLEQTMQQVLLPAAAACEGCSVAVFYVDEAAGGDHFRCDLHGAAGEPVAELDVFHRPGLAPEAAKGWGRSRLGGHPASGLEGEMLFVFPGRFEIRAFARADSLRGERRLADLLQSLPLDRLARL